MQEGAYLDTNAPPKYRGGCIIASGGAFHNCYCGSFFNSYFTFYIVFTAQICYHKKKFP